MGHTPSWATLALGGLLLSGCASQPPSPPQPSAVPTEPSPAATDVATVTPGASTSPNQPRRLEGWLSIVWNDEPHFLLALDDGQAVQLRMDEELTAPLGGPLALDRTRVSVLAVAEGPHVYKVLSIDAEGVE